MTIGFSSCRALSRCGFFAFVALLVATFGGAARAQDAPPSTPARSAATEALVPVEETAANVVPPDAIDEALLDLPIVSIEVKLEGKRWAKPTRISSVRIGEKLTP